MSDAEVAAELEKHDILVEGLPSDRITRTEKHRLTIRKPARLMNIEEARAVLYSREAAITGSTIAELRDQVERLYAVEDSPNYGYPRLKDRTGTSLFQHLHNAGLVHLSARPIKDSRFMTCYRAMQLVCTNPLHDLRGR